MKGAVTHAQSASMFWLACSKESSLAFITSSVALFREAMATRNMLFQFHLCVVVFMGIHFPSPANAPTGPSSSPPPALNSSPLLSSSLSSPTRRLHEVTAVQRHLDDVRRTLVGYTAGAYPSQRDRAERALEAIVPLRRVAKEMIQDLFFKKTIGDAAIERLLCDMYKNNFYFSGIERPT